MEPALAPYGPLIHPDPAAGDSGHGREIAADQEPAAGIHSDRVDQIIGRRAWVKILIQGAIWIQSGHMVSRDTFILGKVATDVDGVVVDRDRADGRIGSSIHIERCIQRPIIVQTGNEVTLTTGHRGEKPGNDDFGKVNFMQRDRANHFDCL